MKRVISRTIGIATALAIGMSVLTVGAPASATAAATDLPTITVAMDGTSIAVGGTLQSGAVQVESTTTAAAYSEPLLFRLNEGVTAADLIAALATPELRDPNNVSHYGAIVFDAEVGKGATSDVQTTLEAADYVAFDAKAGNPTKWPYTAFTIADAAQPATLPAADATVRAIEFGFRGPGTLHDGQVVRFQDGGFLVHMIVGLRTANAADARRLALLLLAGKDGKASRLAKGFVSFMDPVSPGAVQQQTLDTKPGTYVLACFMDTQDGREHTMLGMVRIVKVVAA